MTPPLDADVSRLVDRLWSPDRPGSPVRVTTGALAHTHRPVERYVVVPSLRRPRFLVPADAPRAVASSFSAFLTTPSTRSRLVGRALAAAFRSGGADRLFRDQLTVGLDRRIPLAEVDRYLVTRHLATVVDSADAVAIHPVRRATPNAKPTLRLFDRAGRPLGYAKIGWSEASAGLVRNEAAVLRDLGGEVGGLLVPLNLSSGTWEGVGLTHEVLVTSPLPGRLGVWRATPERDPSPLRAVAASSGCTTQRLAGSPYAASVRQRLARQGAADEVSGALRRWLTDLEHGATPITFGRWHGDWVSWNLATTDNGGAVWDWEYSAPLAPVGFDLLHWYFQGALAHPRATLPGADEAVRVRLPLLGLMDVSSDSWELVADLYVLELLTRAVSLAAQGSGWNPKLRPFVSSYIAQRSR